MLPFSTLPHCHLHLCLPKYALVVSVTLSETTRLLSGSSETTGFSVLVNWVGDPVDTGISLKNG